MLVAHWRQLRKDFQIQDQMARWSRQPAAGGPTVSKSGRSRGWASIGPLPLDLIESVPKHAPGRRLPASQRRKTRTTKPLFPELSDAVQAWRCLHLPAGKQAWMTIS